MLASSIVNVLDFILISNSSQASGTQIKIRKYAIQLYKRKKAQVKFEVSILPRNVKENIKVIILDQLRRHIIVLLSYHVLLVNKHFCLIMPQKEAKHFIDGKSLCLAARVTGS